MKINLYYSLYYDPHPERRKELEKCFEMNVKAGFDSLNILCEEKDLDYLNRLMFAENLFRMPNTSISISVIPNRASFQDFFSRSNIYAGSGEVNACCNADIFFTPEELTKIRNINWNPSIVLCLSRWDVATLTQKGDVDIAHHLSRNDSADSWFWLGQCRVKDGNLKIGYCGSDNGIAFRFQEAGYRTFNCSNDLKTYHYHLCKINNYRTADGEVKAEQTYPPPYAFHEPCNLSNVR